MESRKMSHSFGGDPIPGLEILTPSRGVIESEQRAPDRLRILSGPKAGQEFRLNGLRILVGRSDPPAIRVDVDLTECEYSEIPVVSRRHAELQWVNGDLQITDLGSTNGTWVNGHRLDTGQPGKASPPVTLFAGDRLLVANLELELMPKPTAHDSF
jgi:pSer/pThr/pTyr-binding forkhead associated (FHA) protein